LIRLQPRQLVASSEIFRHLITPAETESFNPQHLASKTTATSQPQPQLASANLRIVLVSLLPYSSSSLQRRARNSQKEPFEQRGIGSTPITTTTSELLYLNARTPFTACFLRYWKITSTNLHSG
jgi:hypothetical protein